MIRYLNQEEKRLSRPLWKQVFFEDSESFLDYYYSEKTKDNQILTAWRGEILAAMLHRNPYRVMVKDQVWNADYIAGVATRPDCRHQGLMRRLLERSLSDLYVEEMGFCFLVPADPAIYTPFGFTYICNLPVQSLNEAGKMQLVPRLVRENAKDYETAARFARELLKKDYEVFALRDEDYYRSLTREVRSDNGDLKLLFLKGNRAAGVWAYYGEGEKTRRELLCLPEYLEDAAPPRPNAMGRIVHLERFVSAICLKESCPVPEMTLLLEVQDDFIPRNSGIFEWRLDHGSSSLIRVSGEGGAVPAISVGIGRLASWLFGYESLTGEHAEWIQTLNGVYFDEIS